MTDELTLFEERIKISPEQTLHRILNTNDTIRTLTLYQPFAGLMQPPWNKIETRYYSTNVRGLVLIIAGKKCYKPVEVAAISGGSIAATINGYMKDPANQLAFKTGRACAIGVLRSTFKMPNINQIGEKKYVPSALMESFVAYDPNRWCWQFEGVLPIPEYDSEKYQFKGKQGWGILSKTEREQIVELLS